MPVRGDGADQLDDGEWPDSDSMADGELANDTHSCPFCKVQVYEDAERCPHCGNYLFNGGSSLRPKPWWVLAGVVVSLLVVLYWIFQW